MNTNLIWDEFLKDIASKLNNDFIFSTWFEGTKLVKFDDNGATVSVPTPIHIKYLNDVYLDIIIQSFNEITNTNTTFTFINEDKSNEIPVGKPKYTPKETNLNTNYTFDNFVVGNSNKLAHRCAVAIAEKPGTMYNPFFIYGPSGLGKTHLIQAIGNYVTEHSSQKVIYVNSQKFLEDFIDSLDEKKVSNFKEKYRSADVLIIDDIQFLTKANKTQEEFFHTFNILHQANKQIIISSDRSPHDLKKLEERLRTRFNWGISTSIEPPEFDLRVQILKRKIDSENLQVDISDEVIEYIATVITSDVRELEGTLRLLLANATLLNTGSDIDLNFAFEVLNNAKKFRPKAKNIVEEIINEVSDTYNISVADLRSSSRKKEINFPRQIAMYLIRESTDYSLTKIGYEFGNRHHTTVMNSCNKIQKLLISDIELKKVVLKIKENL